MFFPEFQGILIQYINIFCYIVFVFSRNLHSVTRLWLNSTEALTKTINMFHCWSLDHLTANDKPVLSPLYRLEVYHEPSAVFFWYICISVLTVV